MTEIRLAERMGRLGTESAFEVLAQAKALEATGKALVVVSGLNAIPGVSCLPPAGAFYTFPNITGTGMPTRDLARRLLDEAINMIIDHRERMVRLLPSVEVSPFNCDFDKF